MPVLNPIYGNTNDMTQDDPTRDGTLTDCIRCECDEDISVRLTRLAYADGRAEVASRDCDLIIYGQMPVHITAGQRLTLEQAVIYPYPVTVCECEQQTGRKQCGACEL